MKRPVLPSAIVVLAILVTACGDAARSPAGSDGGGGGDGSADGSGDGFTHPEDGELVASVANEGGFVPVEAAVTQLPHFVLLGDGRVIVQGAQTLEFPGPLLTPLMVRTLTEDGIQQVIGAFADTGLFTEDRELLGAQNVVVDAPDTVFTIRADGADVTVRVYALGFLMPDMPADELGIDAEEAEAHRVLSELNEQLTLIDETLPAGAFADAAWRPYESQAYRLYISDVTGEPQDELAPEPRKWPLDSDPAAFGEAFAQLGEGARCGVVEGAEAEAWLAELEEANQLTTWTDAGGRRFAVTPRPILPFEDAACA
jgi:hypothetical protein